MASRVSSSTRSCRPSGGTGLAHLHLRRRRDARQSRCVCSAMNFSTAQIGFVFFIIRFQYCFVCLVAPAVKKSKLARRLGPCHFLIVIGACCRFVGFLWCFIDVLQLSREEGEASAELLGYMIAGGCVTNTGMALYDVFHETLGSEADSGGADTSSMMAWKSSKCALLPSARLWYRASWT